MLKPVARWISHGLNPAGVALAIWTCWWCYYPNDGLVVLLGMLFYIVFPGLSIVYGLRTGRMRELYPTVRQQRNGLLLMGGASYGLGGGILWIMDAHWLLLVAGMSFTLATLLVYFINLRWKISIHCVGVGGAAALLFPIVGPYLAWLGLLAALLVGWARLYLRVHTPQQVLAGFALGAGVSLAVYWFIK